MVGLLSQTANDALLTICDQSGPNSLLRNLPAPDTSTPIASSQNNAPPHNSHLPSINAPLAPDPLLLVPDDLVIDEDRSSPRPARLQAHAPAIQAPVLLQIDDTLSTMPPGRLRTHPNLPEVNFAGSVGYLVGTTQIADQQLPVAAKWIGGHVRFRVCTQGLGLGVPVEVRSRNIGWRNVAWSDNSPVETVTRAKGEIAALEWLQEFFVVRDA